MADLRQDNNAFRELGESGIRAFGNRKALLRNDHARFFRKSVNWYHDLLAVLLIVFPGYMLMRPMPVQTPFKAEKLDMPLHSVENPSDKEVMQLVAPASPPATNRPTYAIRQKVTNPPPVHPMSILSAPEKILYTSRKLPFRASSFLTAPPDCSSRWSPERNTDPSRENKLSEAFITIETDQSYDSLFDRLQESWENDDIVSQESLSEAILTECPEDATASYYYADALWRSGRFPEAVRYFKRASKSPVFRESAQQKIKLWTADK